MSAALAAVSQIEGYSHRNVTPLRPAAPKGMGLRCASGGTCANGPCPCPRPCDEVERNSPLVSEGEQLRFKRGDVLWSQGEPAGALFSICTGAVKLTRRWDDNREMILDLAFRGQLIGEGAAVPGAVYSTNCIALTSGRAMRVPADQLQRQIRFEPTLLIDLLALAHQRHGVFTRRLDETAHGSVEHRLAKVLLRIGDEVGLRDSRGTFIPVRLSRGDLADLVGCRVETTIRVMTRWQREGVVETQREGLVLQDRSVLEKASLDPS